MRKFALPENANTDKISAVCQDGVLTVTVEKLPPPEPKKPKTIEVGSFIVCVEKMGKLIFLRNITLKFRGWLAEEDKNRGKEKEISGAFLEIQGEGELYVWRVEEDSFTVSAVSLALEVDLRRLKLNRALREKDTTLNSCLPSSILICSVSIVIVKCPRTPPIFAFDAVFLT
ncbi:17.2 kDa class II heat shock protein [Vitis vinifera]|uniref:17.2 kDa class II heat shock protein n=1 Tax=Vitis vinifera TaxID=29760 RepID=A0A438K892_VITVI|nr:17.2 kDa class II heat shock protein [Vitis vinifera]